MRDDSHPLSDSEERWFDELLGLPIEPPEINDLKVPNQNQDITSEYINLLRNTSSKTS